MSEKIRIAYLSHDGLTDPLGQSQILPYILGLEKLGYWFTVISFEKQEALIRSQVKVETSIQNKNIQWKKIPYHRKPAIVSTIWGIYSLWKAVEKEHHKNEFQIVHCRSYIASLVGQRMKKVHKVKFLFDMRGFWADERVEGGLWSLDNALYNRIYKFFKRKEKEFIEQADYIISLTENAKEEIQSWGIASTPISVIPTCVDLNLFNPEKINLQLKFELRKKLGIGENDFVLLYLGSWGTWYLVNKMLEFFERLKQKKPNSKFLIVSNDESALKMKSNSILVTSLSREEVPLVISLANAATVFIKPSYSKKASSATKIGELLAMNIPIILNEGWGDVEMMRGVPNIFIVNDLKDYQFDKVESRSYCENNLSLHVGLGKYHSVYQQLTD